MTVYLQTARLEAGNPLKHAVLQKESVFFSTRGWTAFAAEMSQRAPEIATLLARLDGPVTAWPTHSTFERQGEPMQLVWTTDECRQLFRGLSAASSQATEKAYDFWEFLALVCCGINEEGITAY